MCICHRKTWRVAASGMDSWLYEEDINMSHPPKLIIIFPPYIWEITSHWSLEVIIMHSGNFHVKLTMKVNCWFSMQCFESCWKDWGQVGITWWWCTCVFLIKFILTASGEHRWGQCIGHVDGTETLRNTSIQVQYSAAGQLLPVPLPPLDQNITLSVWMVHVLWDMILLLYVSGFCVSLRSTSVSVAVSSRCRRTIPACILQARDVHCPVSTSRQRHTQESSGNPSEVIAQVPALAVGKKKAKGV